MTKLILGTVKPDATVLAILRERLKPGQTWFAFQNHPMDSADLGRLQFLCCGSGCTFTDPPARMPDSHLGIGWRYLLVGKVDMETGEIVENQYPSGLIAWQIRRK
jgi:hypothetical protein